MIFNRRLAVNVLPSAALLRTGNDSIFLLGRLVDLFPTTRRQAGNRVILFQARLEMRAHWLVCFVLD